MIIICEYFLFICCQRIVQKSKCTSISMGFELFVQTEKNGAQFHGFLPFLCDLVLIFSSALWGQSSTWQFFSPFLTFFPLPKQVNWGFKKPRERSGTELT